MPKLSSEEIEVEARQIATLALFYGVPRRHTHDLMNLLIAFGRGVITLPLEICLANLDQLMLHLTECWQLPLNSAPLLRRRLLRFGTNARLRDAMRATN